MKVLFVVIITLALVVNTVPSGNTSSDQCKDIVSEGLKAKYNLFQFGTYSAVFRKALCYRKEQVDSLKASGSTDIAIPLAEVLLSIGASAEYDKLQELRIKYCGSSNIELSSTDIQRLSIDVLPTPQVEAWRACMLAKNNAGGGQWETEGFDRSFNFLIRWGPTPNVPSAKIKTIAVTGARCQKTTFLPSGTVVSSQWLPMPCIRDADGKAVSIAVQFNPTTLGGISAQMPAVDFSAPPPLPACQYAVTWKDKDVAGTPFKEVFTVAPNSPGVERVGAECFISIIAASTSYRTLAVAFLT